MEGDGQRDHRPPGVTAAAGDVAADEEQDAGQEREVEARPSCDEVMTPTSGQEQEVDARSLSRSLVTAEEPSRPPGPTAGGAPGYGLSLRASEVGSAGLSPRSPHSPRSLLGPEPSVEPSHPPSRSTIASTPPMAPGQATPLARTPAGGMPGGMRPVVETRSMGPGVRPGSTSTTYMAGMRPVTGPNMSAPLPGKAQNEPSVAAIKEAMGQMQPQLNPLESVLSWIETTTEDSLVLEDGLDEEDIAEPLANHVRKFRGLKRRDDDGLFAVAEEQLLDVEGPEGAGDLPDEPAPEVPSDHETPPPREPPRAPTTVPMLLKEGQARSGTAKKGPPTLKTDANSLTGGAAHATNEEEEWFHRQKISGVIGRMVRYIEGDKPMEDILGFRCSRTGRIMITAIREDGRAARAGVNAGDELKSIDGWKGFRNCPAHVIHGSLRAPATLIFVGFVGKLQAEVRVKRPAEPSCGLPTGRDIVPALGSARGKAWSSVRLCDEVVFQPGSLSVFILTKQETPRNRQPPADDAVEKQAMYELHSSDARHVVQKALSLSASSPLFSI